MPSPHSNLYVRTVQGDINPDSLGITLPHEHIFIDLSCYWHEPSDPYLRKYVDQPVKLDNLWALLRRDPYISRDNLLLTDMETAVRELMDFKDAGGKTIVDLTTKGIGPRPRLLKKIASRTGLNVISG